MFEKFKKYVEQNGAAKTAYLLGFKDTFTVRNWLSAKKIPEKHIPNVESLFLTKITIVRPE